MLGGWGGGAGLYLGGFQFCPTKTKHNPKQTKNHHCSLRGLGAGTVAKGGVWGEGRRSGKHGALSPVLIKHERVGNHFSGNHGDNQRSKSVYSTTGAQLKGLF